jgi:hypothetical protein
MSTVRDVVSRVRSANKWINANGLVSDRLIAAEAKSRAILLIKREANLRRLWNTDTIFTTIPCLSMKSVPIADCGDYTSALTVSRSIEKLPRISEGNYQYLISLVSDLESSQVVKYMPIKRFINRLRLGLKTNEVYFWIQDQYLYITNPKAKSVKISAFFEDDIPYSVLYPKSSNCNGGKVPDCPDNPLDLEFKCPGYLENQVVEMTTEYLRKTYLVTSDIKTDAEQDTQRRQ